MSRINLYRSIARAMHGIAPTGLVERWTRAMHGIAPTGWLRRFVGAMPCIALICTPVLAADSQSQIQCRSFSGNVSWYGTGFQGKKTASGELYDMAKLTAAHLRLPFQTKVLVEDPKTGRTAIVKVNDRGPFVKTRIMDVSREGGRLLGILGSGVTYADCLVIDDNQPPAAH